MLNQIRRHNPKLFYKYFQRKKSHSSDVDPTTFFNHFKELSLNRNATTMTTENVRSDNSAVFDELDQEITQNEIETAISNLKRDKSHGTDLLINEYFIEFKQNLLPIVQNLCNRILQSGIFPKMWAKSVIVPVFKKGDSTDPNNYRGISLISCFCKLFTSILNNRLINWANENNVITDAQFGFQPNIGTAEAIFCLSSIISMSLRKKKRLYCCFIDFKKAFDTVER